MYFEDREQAAHLLANRLSEYRGKNPLILAIPRGAVPMGTILAQELEGELSLVLVHKIPAPGFQEFAIGSIGISGYLYKNPEADFLGIPDRYVTEEAERQLDVIHERARAFHLDRLPQSYRDRVVIILDDGIATGATVLAAIREVRSQRPRELIVAAAVAPPTTAEKIRSEADRLILLDEPSDFFAVGQFFSDFPQVADEEVIELLRPFEKPPTPPIEPLTPTKSR